MCAFPTKNTQVQPHPCDRDYQHVQGLMGCAPGGDASSPAARSPMGLVSMDGNVPRRAYPSSSTVESMDFGTLAQTLTRSGYMEMLGRPPFNYSDGSPMRKSGFMSAERLLNGRGESIFVPCKSVKQCFQVIFSRRRNCCKLV